MAGVKATLQMMKKLVNGDDTYIGGKKHPAIRAKALSLTHDLPQKDYIGEIHNLFDYVQNGIRYVRDIYNVETVHYPEQVMYQESGDCDDKAVLLASLLESIGHPARFVAVGFQPGHFSHVFVDTLIGNGKWLSLDTTEPQPMGWRPPGIVSVLPWHL